MPNFEQTRFMQGDMGRKLDDAQDHSDIAPRNPKTPGDKALHRAWYKDPGSADIKGIDDQGTLPPKDPKQPKQPKQPDQPKTKTDKNTLYVDEGNGSIWAVTGGNKKQREELAAKATKNFSKAERKAFNRVVIEIAKSYAAKRGASGYYQSDAWMPKNKTVEKALVNWPGSKTPAPKISKELQTKFDNQTRYVVNVAKGPPSKGHKVHQTFFRFTTGIDGMSARNRAEAQLKQLKKEGWQGFVTTPQDKSAQLTAAEESQYQDYKKSQRRPSTKHHYIRMGSGYLDGDIITHELVHHVRMGRSADRQSGHIKRYTGKDKDSEESSTELETTARHDPWIQGPKAIDPDKLGNWDMASYYRRISEKKHPYDYSQAARLQQGLNNQDRSIILQGAHNRRLSNAEVNKALDQVQKNPDKYINAGIRDPKISKRIDNRYDQTVIKEMGKNIKGADERIDRYYAALDKSGKAKTKLHIRAAGQGRNKEAAKTVLSKVPGSGTIVEYNDGKAKTIGKFENPKQRNGFTNKRKNRFN
tara:strand:+ start:1145 stop:2731 length:1587 start_codon:yes stop_codon:yes gene_type:complete